MARKSSLLIVMQSRINQQVLINLTKASNDMQRCTCPSAAAKPTVDLATAEPMNVHSKCNLQ